MELRLAALCVAVAPPLLACGGETDCTGLSLDPGACTGRSDCGFDAPLPPVEGARVPATVFLGAGNRHWFRRTEVTLEEDGSVHVATLSDDFGDSGDDGRVTRELARAVLDATLPALVDAAERPEIDPVPDAPIYEFEVSPDDLHLGPVWHSEGEVAAAPALCCLGDAYQLISRCVAGHEL